MSGQHPNLTLLSKLDIGNLDASRDLFSDDFVWHYFNPKLPDLEGDYIGLDGLRNFFAVLAEKTKSSFAVEPVSATPVGDELVFIRTRNTMQLAGTSTAIDVVLVWRIVDGKLAEAWDIPSAFTLATQEGGDASD